MAIRKEHITTSDPTTQQIAAWREYASINDTAQAALHKACLKAAMKVVGDWHDVTLLSGSVRIDVTEREDNAPVVLYGTPDTITSVKDGAGNALGYTYADGAVTPDGYTAGVSVVYTTKVNTGTLDDLIVKAWRYATALYDGEDETSLSNILLAR